MNILYDFWEVLIYSGLGILLMAIGNFLIDFIIPCSFPDEIKKGNQAIGFVSAGTFIGVGILLKAAIAGPISNVKESLLEGIGGSIMYFGVGILCFMLGYLVLSLLNRKYSLNEELGRGNTAAGIMVCGIFIGLAILISGVIQ